MVLLVVIAVMLILILVIAAALFVVAISSDARVVVVGRHAGVVMAEARMLQRTDQYNEGPPDNTKGDVAKQIAEAVQRGAMLRVDGDKIA